MKFDLYSDLEARGIVKQVTDPALAQKLRSKPLTVYVGFDPTADTLHIGSLLPLMTLARFQKAGHHPIAVVGGATGMIGDPSFKAQERQLLDTQTLEKNVIGIRNTISKFLDTTGPQAARVINNFDWFKGYGYLDFLRDIGKHFTINHMIAKESVRARLEDREHGISYTEFSYMLLQAYDFYVLNRDHGCDVQMGGSDQWGNITAGCELIRRINAHAGKECPEVFGLTHPLVMKADGTKFGKSEQGNIWIDPTRTSPYRFYQYFVQTADEDVGTLLKYFTFLPLPEIQALEESVKTAPEKREAQKRLATEITRFVHGADALAKAERAAQALFGTEIRELDAQTLQDAFSDAPSTVFAKDRLTQGVGLVDLLAETGLCASKGAAKKDVVSGGIYVNNERCNDPMLSLKTDRLLAGQFLVLRKGKKNYHLVRVK